jgi:hypothetical protein
VTENELGGACSTNLNERDHLENLGVDEKMMLELS